jgi:hypothetical protein
MASKIKVTPQKEEMLEEEGPDSPLLDLSDAAAKDLIRSAKKRGYVTYEQLNSVMPSEEVTSEQIKDVLAMMSEMGINVVETEEAEADSEEEAREEPEEEEAESGELVEVTPKTLRLRRRPRPRRSSRSMAGPTATKRCRKARSASPISTRTISRTRCRLPPSRPSSSPRCWRPSIPSPTRSSVCAGCKSRTSTTSCTRPAR